MSTKKSNQTGKGNQQAATAPIIECQTLGEEQKAFNKRLAEAAEEVTLKYAISDNPDHMIEWKGHTLHRIVALRDIPLDTGEIILKGSYGGYIESEKNLSQDGDCWVDGNAKVYEDGKVLDNAYVSGLAEVYGEASVENDASASGHAKIRGLAWVYGTAMISDKAKIGGNACVGDDAYVWGKAKVSGNAKLQNNMMVAGEARIKGDEDFLYIYPILPEVEATFYITKNGYVEVSSTDGIFGIEGFKNYIFQSSDEETYKHCMVMVEAAERYFNDNKRSANRIKGEAIFALVMMNQEAAKEHPEREEKCMFCDDCGKPGIVPDDKGNLVCTHCGKLIMKRKGIMAYLRTKRVDNI